MSRLKKISNNIKYNVISQIFNFVTFFVLLPFIISHAGKELYGVYTLSTTFTGYLGILDFGVASAIIKYVAEFSGKGDHDRLNSVVSASFSFYVFIGCVIALLLVAIPMFFGSLFKIDPVNMSIVKQLFLIAAIASILIWPGRTFEGVLLGSQRYGLLAATSIITTLLVAVSAYFIFSRGLSIIYYSLTVYSFNIIRYFIYYILSQRFQLIRRIVFPYFDRDIFKLIFNFSFFVFLASVINVVIFNLDNFIIGTFVSVSAVTLYSVSVSLQNIFRSFNSLIGGPFFPANAEMEGRGEVDKQRLLLLKGTRLMTLIFIPMVISAIVFCRPFIIQWMGSGFIDSVAPAVVLLIFWIFNGTLEIGAGMLAAKGHVKEIFHIGALNAVLNLTLSLILVRRFGILGVALGTAIPMVFVNFPLMLNLMLKVLSIDLKEYFSFVVEKNLAIYIFVVLVSLLMRNFFAPRSLIIVILQMGISYAAAIGVAYLYVLTSEEKLEIRATIGI